MGATGERFTGHRSVRLVVSEDSRTVEVAPPVHVEVFGGHASLTLTAGSLARFLSAARSLDAGAGETDVVVDDAATAGRERRPLAELAPAPTGRYVRLEPPTDWTLSWERRTTATVSLSGAPSAPLCRTVHLATTDCEGWPEQALAALAERLAAG